MLSIEVIAPMRHNIDTPTFKGKSNKLQRAVMQHRKEAIENRMLGIVDRATEQKFSRSGKRKRFAYIG